MGEVVIKVDVPEGMQDSFEKAIDVVLRRFLDEIRWTVAKEIVAKSKLNDDTARKLAFEVKESVAERHGV